MGETHKRKKYEEVINNKMFMHQFSDIHNSKIRTKACGAGNNLYAIDIDGDIYPCQRFVGNKEISLGNVFKNDDLQKKFLEEININKFTKCNTCWIRNLCVGGCIYDNFSLTGNINLPYEPYCEYQRKIVTELIRIYLRLSDEEIYTFFKYCDNINDK